MKDKWDGVSFEEWFEKMIREGYTEIVLYVMKSLPEERKEKYREIYKRLMEEKKRENNVSTEV